MNTPRRLALKREALTELHTADLQNVVGAADQAITVRPCTIDESYRICSFRCEWTFNTCEV